MVIRVNVHRGGWGQGLGQGGLTDGLGWFFRPASRNDRFRRGLWIAAGVVILVPLTLLLLAVGLAAAMLFFAVVLVMRIVAVFLPRHRVSPSPRGPGDDGRRNVTVIVPGTSEP